MTDSLEQIASRHDTDKPQSGYVARYARFFEPLRDKPVRLLELGVFRGGSLRMWSEYFPAGTIVGMDLSPNPLGTMPPRTHFVQGSQDDIVLLDDVRERYAPDGFDIVIDDAAHIGTIARTSFLNLFGRHLKPQGLYVIEDWGTGYWASWPGGATFQGRDPELVALARDRIAQGRMPPVDPNFNCHNFGMVGFVKELVDEVAWADISNPQRGNPALDRHPSAISEMTVYNGQVFLRKAG